jgi:hypothetical protein
MKKRGERQKTILQTLLEDKKEYSLFKFAFEAKPELKKNLGITQLPSLNEYMRRLFAPGDKKE